MTDAPKTIWAWPQKTPSNKPPSYGAWCVENQGINGDETEYIRADTANALRREVLDHLAYSMQAHIFHVPQNDTDLSGFAPEAWVFMTESERQLFTALVNACPPECAPDWWRERE